ncbi:hypothetical protein Ddye_004539 [Dipteronia dyeriana]|uniref:Retinoblastoma-associated protein A-box domain-containing protein n=1 Tax=Dipteronia dyeriana TaxID=168575 RepID=A0AAE0CWE6_9ROSI|nr:hypothetical protein Ddye_004539 [Dipteronia dyeriana]
MEANDLMSPSCSPASRASVGLAGGMSKLMPTPVKTAAVSTSKWLQTSISPLPSKPSAELEKFLVLGDRNLVNGVTTRANIVLEAIFPRTSWRDLFVSWSIQNVNFMDSLTSEEKRIEALKLYYKVLESICTSEAKKCSAKDLSWLLSNDKFHRCMLACAAELVLTAHTRVNLLFPEVLERIGITAFDMSKVIEIFIRQEESLPRELRRHLNSLEEKLLESMVWEKGSSLYNSLIVAKPALSDEIKKLQLLAETMPPLHNISMNNNVASGGLPHQQQTLHKHNLSAGQDPETGVVYKCGGVIVKDDDPPTPASPHVESQPTSLSLKSTFSSPTQLKTPNEGSAPVDAAVNVFFEKIAKLAAFRISSMSERMKLPQQIRERIYLLFQQILTRETYIFFNRHIDQIILCCFYAIAKISHLNLTFKEIKNNYIKQAQSRCQVICCMFVNRSSQGNANIGQNRVGIITFYNDMFIQNVKSLVKEIVPDESSEEESPTLTNNNGHCPNSPRMSPFPRLPDVSPKKVSSSQNVYLSPSRPSKDAFNSLMGQRSYYAFIGESTSVYRSPSKELDLINECINRTGKRCRRRLNFNGANLPSLISDSEVTNSLLLQNDK